MKPEILAPVGSKDALLAAVRCGADAVYFGTGNFNARRNAGGFEAEGLKEAIDYCHLHSVKCHITLNTLVGDSELEQVIDTVKRTCDCRADALILQDLGVARIVREMCPDIEMHASTQLSTGTPEGINMLAQLGFTRAVLPRELSEREIEIIARNSPVELEMFVHGALCMCVSGQCLLSAFLGSRSGNRGLCAQPCRLPFAADGGTGTDLSLKDLSLIDRLPELYEMGIQSFKIEGRMKRPEYVAAAVTACREALGGKYTSERRHDLEGLFSRSGFTDGYFTGRLGREMFGKREKENVTSATNELLKKYGKLYEKENAVYAVDFEFEAKADSAPVLTACANGEKVRVCPDFVCEKAIKRNLEKETVVSQLSKCGGTVFYAGETDCEIDEGISVPVSVINSLRRDALEKLSQKLAHRTAYNVSGFSFKKRNCVKSGGRKLYIQFSSVEQIPESIEFDRMFLPLSADENIIGKYSAGVYVPRGLFGNSSAIEEKLRQSPAKYALCNTLDAVAAAKNAGKQITGGPFMNIFNSLSLEEAEELGISEQVLSYEMTARQISSVCGNIATGCVVYGRTPLMLTRNCPVRNGTSCGRCGQTGSLTDRKDISFPVRCENGFSQLFNSVPTYMLDRLDEIKGTDFDMLVFTTETKQEVERILSAYKNRSRPEGEYTRGLFTRGVE